MWGVWLIYLVASRICSRYVCHARPDVLEKLEQPTQRLVWACAVFNSTPCGQSTFLCRGDKLGASEGLYKETLTPQPLRKATLPVNSKVQSKRCVAPQRTIAGEVPPHPRCCKRNLAGEGELLHTAGGKLPDAWACAPELRERDRSHWRALTTLYTCTQLCTLKYLLQNNRILKVTSQSHTFSCQDKVYLERRHALAKYWTAIQRIEEK